MKWLESNLVVIFWAVIFGEVVGYIGGTLEQMTWKPLQIGVSMAVVALIAVNGITLLSRDDQASSEK
ncbi:YjzD family protein [Levilactobacillus tongjiangensis]|uniref:YjzD family protein n=1 Tax=Levilactobacillus tongjiangensis TaxID=2486023 RepID=A0ABW1SQW0_9LACO|nr:YjzD family protein [Levilactobacillus tongjiangensis]